MAQIILDSNNNLIQGDFDNATLNNRTKLQTTTTNATTNVYVAPNGSSTSAGVSVANNSSLTNASKIVMATNGSTDTQIISGVNGSGSYLPLSFYTNNALGMQLSTAGNLTVTGSISAASGLGGMTLLGTLTTTSGTTQTLSGLTLTNYKQLNIIANGVGYSSGTAGAGLAMNTYLITRTISDPNTGYYGVVILDLSSGATFSGLSSGSFIASNSVQASNSTCMGNLSAINTSTTSLAFTFNTGNTFATGTIKVYGVS
jgi:hypothetical protein